MAGEAKMTERQTRTHSLRDAVAFALAGVVIAGALFGATEWGDCARAVGGGVGLLVWSGLR